MLGHCTPVRVSEPTTRTTTRPVCVCMVCQVRRKYRDALWNVSGRRSREDEAKVSVNVSRTIADHREQASIYQNQCISTSNKDVP